MTSWAMVIDLDKCVACQGCSIACRQENNLPAVTPQQAWMGRTFRWNDVFPFPINDPEAAGEYPNAKVRYMARPCMHCMNPPCTKVCPVQATYRDAEGLVRQNYSRCIGCRFCTVACPYGARYFNWYAPEWPEGFDQYKNPDRLESKGDSEGPTPRPKGVVEKCTFCVHRLPVPACNQACSARARYFGDLDDPDSEVSRLARSPRAHRLLEELGTEPKVIYLKEGAS